MINPEFVERTGMQLEDEGCLSVPGFNATVVRPERAVVRGLDRNGEVRLVDGTGLLARAFQHEMDHLDGTLFVDLLRGIKRDLIVRKIRKEMLSQLVPPHLKVFVASLNHGTHAGRRVPDLRQRHPEGRSNFIAELECYRVVHHSHEWPYNNGWELCTLGPHIGQSTKYATMRGDIQRNLLHCFPLGGAGKV
jgi:hypothetical protein